MDPNPVKLGTLNKEDLESFLLYSSAHSSLSLLSSYYESLIRVSLKSTHAQRSTTESRLFISLEITESSEEGSEQVKMKTGLASAGPDSTLGPACPLQRLSVSGLEAVQWEQDSSTQSQQ